jgi:hypothetical protein
MINVSSNITKKHSKKRNNFLSIFITFFIVNHVVFRIDFDNRECGQGSSFLSDGNKAVDASITEINFQTFLDVIIV